MLNRLRSRLHNQRSIRLTATPGWYRTSSNAEMWLSASDWMDVAFVSDAYCTALLAAMRQFIKEGDYCIDVGAHKGYVTLHMSNLVGAKGHVFAFEPDYEVRKQLLNNCEHNRANNVSALEYALADRNGEADFFVSRQSGWSSRFPNATAKRNISHTTAVPIRSLDNLITTSEVLVNYSRLSFIKIDCEGSEPFILSGMKQVLTKSQPIIWLEVNEGSLSAADTSISELQRVIKGLGLKMYSWQFRRRLFRSSDLQFQLIDKIPLHLPPPFDIVVTERTLS